MSHTYLISDNILNIFSIFYDVTLKFPNLVFIFRSKGKKIPVVQCGDLCSSLILYTAFPWANWTLYLCVSVVAFYDLKAPYYVIIQINGDAYHQDVTARGYYINGNQARILNIEYWIGHDITQ